MNEIPVAVHEYRILSQYQLSSCNIKEAKSTQMRLARRVARVNLEVHTELVGKRRKKTGLESYRISYEDSIKVSVKNH